VSERLDQQHTVVRPGIGGCRVAHDERRLLRLVPTEKPAPQAATVLQNWQSAVRTP